MWALRGRMTCERSDLVGPLRLVARKMGQQLQVRRQRLRWPLWEGARLALMQLAAAVPL